MGRKSVLDEGQVVDAAFEIARAEGMDAVSVRSIGERLGCSTQPVYTACGSMTKVREEVVRRAATFAESALRAATEGPPLLSLGLATLTLAQEEPHLFEVIVGQMRDRGADPPAEVLAAMRADPQLASLPRRRLVLLHEQLWFLTLGLATLLTADGSARAMTLARHILEQSGAALIRAAQPKESP